MIIEKQDLTDKYRRLRILYNRVMVFGDHPFYPYWASHLFNTALGPRNFVCSLPFINSPDEIMDFYYEDENGNTLFEIEINKQVYKFKGWKMNEEQTWLAIHELEELSYKELEKYYENYWRNTMKPNYQVYWCDELLNKIEEIAKEKYPKIDVWVDTGSRLNVALAMLEQFRRDLKVRK